MNKRVITLIVLFLIAASPVAAQTPPETQTLNLKSADIQVLISMVADITGRNFVVDPRVKGEVTVISAQPMSADELYQVFLSILRVHGYAAVESGAVTKIVPDAAARQDALQSTAQNLGPDELLTRTLQIEHVPAAELIPILRPLLPQSAHVAAHAGSNMLVISDRAANVERLMRIIQRIDTGSDNEVEMMTLHNANAAEMVRTLGNLESGQEAVKMIADERTNTIILSGDRARRLKMKALILHLDTPLEVDGNSQVIFLHYASAEALVPLLDGVAAALVERPGGTEGVPERPNIYAHPDTNALVVTGSPAIAKSLRSVIQQLDIPRAQVLVEAVIAEVSTDFADELGVQWQLALGVDSDGALQDGTIGGTNFGNDGGNILAAATNPLGVGAGLNLGYLSGSITLPGSDTPVLQLGALVRALESDADSDVLSTPSIVTLDNQEAKIQVGQEVPFLTGQYTDTGASETAVRPFQTIQREDVGVTLQVTPHINEGDSVVLDIDQEISSLAKTTGAVDLITNKRTLKTTVMVPDNSILVLGGLISEELQESISKVPALGDIPIVGNLFRYRSSKRVKRNLMIFMRPTILHDQATREQVTNSKYNLLRMRQIERKEKRGSGFSPEQRPVLPELQPADEIDVSNPLNIEDE